MNLTKEQLVKLCEMSVDHEKVNVYDVYAALINGVGLPETQETLELADAIRHLFHEEPDPR